MYGQDNYDPTMNYFNGEQQNKGGSSIVKILVILLVVVGLGVGGYFGYKHLSGVVKDSKEEQKQEEKKEEPKQEEKKEEEKEQKLTVEYGTGYYHKESEDKKLKIYNTRALPSFINIPGYVTIIGYMSNVTKDNWEMIKKTTDDLLKEYEESVDAGSPMEISGDIGVKYYSVHEQLGNVLVFNSIMFGNMSGISWNDLRIYNFDVRDSKFLNLAELCNNELECKDYMLNSFLQTLKQDERFPNLFEDYEDTVKEELFKDGLYGFTVEGFGMIIPKGLIASDADGIFQYVIPYSVFNNYLKDDYKV